MGSFDFIVVGGGTSGSLLASRLARSLPRLSLLLLDAGGENTNREQQTFGERHWTREVPGYNWGYKTVPQKNLKGREIDYSRGKGLGGSTAINFCVWTRGPSADYDHWADLVGDDTWRWKNTQKRFKKVDLGLSKPEVHVGTTSMWDPSFGDFLERSWAYYPRNFDHNSGDPLGVAVCQLSIREGHRVTASGAFFNPPPPNLTIMINAPVVRVLFQGKKAAGVEVNGKKIFARHEVILSAGAVDSPKLLLLSGVGPPGDLNQLGIPVTQSLPGVGKALQDHLFVFLVTKQKPGSHHRISYIDPPKDLEEARKQWAVDQTGPLSSYHLPQMIGFIRSDKILASEEFAMLSSESQELLRMKTKPTHEILSQAPYLSAAAPDLYLSTAVVFSGTEAGGEVTLRSSDPADDPMIDPNFLSHPFDRRTAIQSVRETLEFLQTPLLAKDHLGLAAGPAGVEDDEILVRDK
ncbi:MAG: hypothetical protein Q9225_002814 [Loekoesia sp. 1 TL-2023]